MKMKNTELLREERVKAGVQRVTLLSNNKQELFLEKTPSKH